MKVDFKNKALRGALRARIEGYEFQVGILHDSIHKKPAKGLKTYAGGPARNTSRKNSTQTINEVAQSFSNHLGKNFLLAPWSSRKNSDIVRFIDQFLRIAFGASQPKRLENLLQAVIRNPILRGDYGKNSKLAKKIKGFDRLGIDTAQMFRAITAKVKRTRSRVQA